MRVARLTWMWIKIEKLDSGKKLFWSKLFKIYWALNLINCMINKATKKWLVHLLHALLYGALDFTIMTQNIQNRLNKVMGLIWRSTLSLTATPGCVEHQCWLKLGMKSSWIFWTLKALNTNGGAEKIVKNHLKLALNDSSEKDNVVVCVQIVSSKNAKWLSWGNVTGPYAHHWP